MLIDNTIDSILSYRGNIIINASAGTGKTTLLADKINADFFNLKSHKGFIAVTFTNNATKELKNRLSRNYSNSCIDTNTSFAFKEIVLPFVRDFLDNEIDNISLDFSKKFDSFDECIDCIKINKIVPSYKETSRNFLFHLALEILKKSKASRLYLKSKYKNIYIDEYQDCDSDMHDLFMYICLHLSIVTFVVGDYKQAIYSWRGANPSLFLSILENSSFKKFELLENHRSCIQIVNFSNLIYPKTRNLYTECSDRSSIICLVSTSQKWFLDVKSYIDTNNNCALIRRKNNDAKKCAVCLNNFVFIFKPELLNISDNASWLYVNLAKLFIVPKYSVYCFLEDIPDYIISKNFKSDTIIQILYSIKKNLDTQLFNTLLSDLFNRFGCSIKQEYVDVLRNTIKEKESNFYFYIEDLKNVSLTCHSSKGLGFEQVIIFINDYTLEESELSEFYVAVTRAKTKLIMVVLKDELTTNLKSFKGNLSRILRETDKSFEDFVTVVKESLN